MQRVGRMYYPKHPRPHSGAPGIEGIVLEGSKETLSEANSGTQPGSRSRSANPPSTPVSPLPPESPPFRWGDSPQLPSPISHFATQ